MTIPTFSRVEIRTNDKIDLITAAGQLRALATDLYAIARQQHTDEEAVILAHHKIKATSQRLRSRPPEPEFGE